MGPMRRMQGDIPPPRCASRRLFGGMLDTGCLPRIRLRYFLNRIPPMPLTREIRVAILEGDREALLGALDNLCDRLDDGQSIRRGCICPPGSNKECEAPLCPRKPFPKF